MLSLEVGEFQLDRSCKERHITQVKEEINVLLTIEKGRLSGSAMSCVGTACYNTLWEEITKGRIEVTRRRRTSKKPLHDLKETKRYWKLKEEVLDRTVCRTCFGRRGYGPTIRRTTE